MVNEGIVLGHKISERGIEVDKAKFEAIEKMPYPKDIKCIRSFLGHAGFYRRFIKDFSKTSRPLTNLLQKDVPYVFDEDCKEAFEVLKRALITAPIVQLPDWNLPFEIMCDASDYAVGVVLGQGIDKKLNVIHYASKTLDSAQKNYATTEKEFLAPGEHGRAGAHRAGLQGDHQGRTGEPPAVPVRGGRSPQREHLGVRGGVVQQLALVAAAPDDPARGIQNQGRDGNVA